MHGGAEGRFRKIKNAHPKGFGYQNKSNTKPNIKTTAAG